MKAIVTKYRGPTNVRGSRIIATSEGARTIVSYRHDLSTGDSNHAHAAWEHAKKLGWFPEGDTYENFRRKYAEGCLPDGKSHVFVEKE